MRSVDRLVPSFVTAAIAALAAGIVSSAARGSLDLVMPASLFVGLLVWGLAREAMRPPPRGQWRFGAGAPMPGASWQGASWQATTTRAMAFDRFNDTAKRVLALAQDEAIRFNHNYIGTEHLLVGLVREADSLAAQALAALGVDLAKVRTALEQIIGRGEAATSPGEITLTPRTKKVIELAIGEARARGESVVTPVHLLLGLVAEGQGIASGILQSLGVTDERLRAEIDRLRRGGA